MGLDIEVKIRIDAYEVDGADVCHKTSEERPHATVASHWNRDEMVCIKIKGCHEMTFVADDLIEAIKRASR